MAAVVAPLVASVLAVGTELGAAAAATSSRTDDFTFASSVSGESVTCTIEGSLRSTARTDGAWDLTAYVRIAASSSSECFDGLAHLTTFPASGPTGEYDGGGSYVQVVTTTSSEVEQITYEIYFDGCACYTPVYLTPK